MKFIKKKIDCVAKKVNLIHLFVMNGILALLTFAATALCSPYAWVAMLGLAVWLVRVAIAIVLKVKND